MKPKVWLEMDKQDLTKGYIELGLRDFLKYWETIEDKVKAWYLNEPKTYKTKIKGKLREAVYFKGISILIKQ